MGQVTIQTCHLLVLYRDQGQSPLVLLAEAPELLEGDEQAEHVDDDPQSVGHVVPGGALQGRGGILLNSRAFNVTHCDLDKRAGGLELCQPRGDGAAEEGGPEVERDAGEPDDEHPEGDALRPVPQDLERVARDLLRQDGGAVQHAGQQVDLAKVSMSK